MKFNQSDSPTRQLAAAPLPQEDAAHPRPNRATRRSKSVGYQAPSDIARPFQQSSLQECIVNGVGTHIPDRILRLPEVLAMVGIGRTLLLTMVREGKFPAPLHLTARIRGWRLSAIQQFLLAAEARDADQ